MTDWKYNNTSDEASEVDAIKMPSSKKIFAGKVCNLYEQITDINIDGSTVDDQRLSDELDNILSKNHKKGSFLPEMLEMLQIYASRGLTDDSLAMMMGMSIDEFRELRVMDSDFERAIIKGRLPLVNAINATLWKSALGLNEITTETVTVTPEGTTSVTKTVKGKIDTKLLLVLAKNIGGYQDSAYISQTEKQKLIQKDNVALLKNI